MKTTVARVEGHNVYCEGLLGAGDVELAADGDGGAEAGRVLGLSDQVSLSAT